MYDCTHAVSAFQTASKRKPDSFGTAATSCKKSNWTADIPISIPILTATNPWHSSATGPTKTAKADNKPTTSTATKSTSHARLPIRMAIWFGDYYGWGKLEGNTIVDGNHRMVAGLLCNQIPASTPGTAPLSKPRIPLKDIQPDPIDWW